LLVGSPICRNAFCYINYVSRNTLSKLTQHYKENGVVPRLMSYKGRNNKSIKFEEAQSIVDFLKSVARIHALALPGRVPGTVSINFRFFAVICIEYSSHMKLVYFLGFAKTDVQVLPSDLTVKSLYLDYSDSCRAAGKTVRSLTSFRRVWKAVLPTIIISRPTSDLCWTCQQYNYNYNL